MVDKIDQSIKGDSNNQIIVHGNCIVGMNKEEVVELIKTFGYINKDDVIEIVKEVMENIPEDKKIQPNKRIFVPLIQQLSYSMEEDYIKERYKKLLESTMNIDKVDKVHPAFLNILSQLSSDEIKILNALTLTSLPNEPLISMRMKINHEKGLGITQVKYFSDIGYRSSCQFPGNICEYLENLERLKIIEIPFGRKLIDESRYDNLINHPAMVTVRKNNQLENWINVTYEYDKMFFNLTSFGIDFISCCK